MKKKYLTPVAEAVNVRLLSSVLENGGMAGDSEWANTWDSKDNNLEWEEDAASDKPRNINLWEE